MSVVSEAVAGSTSMMASTSVAGPTAASSTAESGRVSDSPSEAVHTLSISRKEFLTSDVVLLELTSADGDDLPPWEPGAHIDLVLREGMVRQYSLCGDPADRSTYEVAVLREPAGRGGSVHIHDVLAEGDTVQVRGPRNHFRLEPVDSYVFVAGGIGVTPLIPMIRVAVEQGASWELLYGGRSRSSMSFVDHLEQTYGDLVAVRPQDEHGLLDLQGLLGTARPGTAVYCCGPEPLLSAIERVCETWPAGALHVERFTPKALDEPVLTGSFEVELSLSGVILTVPPEKSIVAVLEENKIPVVVSCQEGTCGSCETVVLAGIPEHRDSILTPAEQAANETMLVCVSRALTPRLTLEL